MLLLLCDRLRRLHDGHHRSARLMAFLGSVCVLLAQPVPCSAAAPTLNGFFPTGGPRGEAFEVTAGGDVGSWPVDVWCDAPGLQLTPLEEKGKFRVESTAETAPGVYWLRLTNAEGASELRPLVLGQLPEIIESEPNDGPVADPAAAKKEAADDSPPSILWGQAVDLPVTLNGRLGKRGDVDSFSFTLEPGQLVVARLRAQTILGSPVDAILQIAELVQQPVSSASPIPPRTEAYVVEQNHDSQGLDPQLQFRAERAGTYVVRAFGFPSDPNSTIGFTGGDSLVYRLTITTEGIVDHALPIAVHAPAESTPEASSRTVQLFGAGLAPEGISAVAQRIDGTDRWRAFAPGLPGAVELAAVEAPTVMVPSRPAGETEIAAAVEVPLPVVASGRLAAAREIGAAKFTVSKGERLRITVQSRELGFSLDPVVVIRDATGKELERKDAGRSWGDVSFEFSPPADGQYAVEVHDLHHRGGLRFVYQLTIEPATPDFSLTLKESRFVIKPGGTVEIPVAVERRSKFAEAITIRATGLPEGVEAEAVTSAAEGDTAKEVKLVLRAAEGIEPGTGGTFQIEGISEGAPSSGQPAAFPLTPPFAGTHSAVWLTVAK